MEQPTQVFNRIMQQIISFGDRLKKISSAPQKRSRVRYTPMNAKEVNKFFICNEMYPLKY